jgi:NTP pyrophosphatase (non-canonical NTP hydrolase)
MSIEEQAVHHYGAEKQLKMVVGEIGELLTLFGRDAQGRVDVSEWVSEIADVTIMLKQLAIIQCINSETLEKMVKTKLERLSSRMEAEKC